MLRDELTDEWDHGRVECPRSKGQQDAGSDHSAQSSPLVNGDRQRRAKENSCADRLDATIALATKQAKRLGEEQEIGT